MIKKTSSILPIVGTQNRILIKVDSTKEDVETDAGIIIPEDVKNVMSAMKGESWIIGTVIGVSEDEVSNDDSSLSPALRVIFDKRSGMKISTLEDEDLLIMRESDVLAIITE